MGGTRKCMEERTGNEKERKGEARKVTEVTGGKERGEEEVNEREVV